MVNKIRFIAFFIILSMFPLSAFAGEAAHIPAPHQRGLQALDWLMIGLYGFFMLGVGWYYSRKQNSTEEYFLCSRNMGSFAIGISLTASILSTISYLSKPGEMIRYGPTHLWSIIAIPLYFIPVGYLLIPAFMKFRITSAYELLEKNIGLSVRLCGAVIFILVRLSWMALLIYLSSKAVVVMLGWPSAMLSYVVIISGFIAVIYTALGGLRAVVITDLLQFLTLMVGAFLTVIIITIKMGGTGAWWPIGWQPNWQVQPLFSFDLHIRATVTGGMVYAVFYWLCTAGSDQMAIQRYLSTRNVKEARRSFLISSLAYAAIVIVLSVVGMALLGFYRILPEYQSRGDALFTGADYLFPDFIATYMPAGAAGIIVSGIFAAAMSSLDSGINSIVSIITVDFIDRFRKKIHDQSFDVRQAKYLTWGIGVAIVLMSSLMDKVPGNVTEITSKTNGLFIGPLFGLFFMALFVPFATSFGTIVGAIYGLAAAAVIAYWDVLTGDQGLSFQWITALSLVVHIAVGIPLSLIPLKGKGWRTVTGWSVLAAILLGTGFCAIVGWQV
ncbi:sodium-coupled permease [bacterium]|nr:sodium-coupled permease [bacterium]